MDFSTRHKTVKAKDLNDEQLHAFGYFLKMERNRHQKDIHKLNQDLVKLETILGYQIPEPPDNLWIEVE